MGSQKVDPWLLNAWLSARSVARGLPLPVPEYGGFRVDTRSEEEVVRWVFPKMEPGLKKLAQTIDQPRHLLKLCGPADLLQAALTAEWSILAPAYFMRATGPPPPSPLAKGYSIDVERVGVVVHARINSDTGAMVASGHAAEAHGVFIYDRIVTDAGHRRKGLGRAIMQALHAAQQNPHLPELLVATIAGRSLYETLGWETISPYTTAAITARAGPPPAATYR